jgi:predicted NBD/HSP70 family sugar kinase
LPATAKVLLADYKAILRGVSASGAASRPKLAEASRLARSSVSERIRELVDMGLLVEAGKVESVGGRRATRIEFAEGTGLVLALELGSTHAKWRLADFAGRVVAEAAFGIVMAQGADQVLPLVDKGVRAALDERCLKIECLVSCAIGFPGPLDFARGSVMGPPNMTGWDEAPIPELFAKWLPVPTIVDNDVNVMALGDYEAKWRGEGTHDLLFVKYGTGIGCGVVADGKVYRGADGTAGEVGHTPVAGVELPEMCSCGSRNCLEVVASGRALVSRLKAQGRDVEAAADVARLVVQGDLVAMNMVREAGRALGAVMTGIVNFFNPDAIIMGGSIGSLGSSLLAGMREAIYGQAAVFSTRRLRILPSHLGSEAGLRGATLLAWDLGYEVLVRNALGWGEPERPSAAGG